MHTVLSDPRLRSWRRCGVGLVIVVLALLSGWLPVQMPLDIAGVNGIAVSAPPEWNLVWSDEFNGAPGTGVNRSDWQYAIGHGYPGGPGNWGTGEIEYMSDSTANVYQDGAGHLAIKPIRGSDGSWTSGRLETNRADFQPPAGGRLRVQASIQLPNVSGAAAQGYWPAFWMLGAPYRGNYWNWPSIGEFDILENINGANTVWGTVHCGVTPGGPCNETSGIGSNRSGFSPSLQSAFHTYSLEWDRSVSPEELRWYVDGSLFHTVKATQVDPTTWSNATNHGFFIILNVAIGGGWPGGPTSSTVSGQPMLVDDVSVWSSGNSGPTPTTTSPTTTQPTTTTTLPGGTRDARSIIQGESYDGQSGVQVESTADAGGGQNLARLANGDWARYDNVSFGNAVARTFSARVASGATGGVSGLVQVHLDSLDAPPLGSFAIAGTGGWQTWRTVPANVTAITGTHTVYLRFVSAQPADFANLNWFTFS